VVEGEVVREAKMSSLLTADCRPVLADIWTINGLSTD
jgi:hypothetical protein